MIIISEPRPGTCPVIPEGVGGSCVQECQTDEDCADTTHKCCSNGCGQVCIAPQLTGRILKLQTIWDGGSYILSLVLSS